MQDDILFNTKNGIGIITLNRPSALNALNAKMLTALHQQLLQWEKDSAILAVFIESSSPHTFCAGGDIKAVFYSYQENQKNPQKAMEYFKLEYSLNKYIHHYPKPYIALLNGLTMGGGAGISLHGRFRIATKQFSFAMPETGIGFFPDVGMGYLFSRLPNNIGIYMGLTGVRINATEAKYLNLIDVDTTHGTQENNIKNHEKLINNHFRFNTVEEIFAHLENDAHDWAQQTLSVLKQKSPTSLTLTLKHLHTVKNKDFNEAIQEDYKLACFFAEHPDFYEGIRAAVIDKDRKPKWKMI